MRVLYAWQNSNFKFAGVKSPLICHLDLAKSIRSNIDYLHVTDHVDVFCISATRHEIEHIILPRIKSDDHKLKVQCVLQDKDIPGLPFLIDRYVNCIQLIDTLPWRMYNGVCQVRTPFVELKDVKVTTLEGLSAINIDLLKVKSSIRSASSLLKPNLVEV
jgi:hypothetical protein